MPVFAVSAREGIGVDELRSEIAERVSAKKLTRERIEADLRAAGGRIVEASGSGKTRELSQSRIRELEDALAESAGVPTVVDAVERSTRLRAGRATTWPAFAALTRFKSDPLKKLGLDLGEASNAIRGSSRRSMPATTQVQRARVDTEVRALADDASSGLGAPWVAAVRRASTERVSELGDRLDDALAGTDLGAAKLPLWVGLVRVLQWVLILGALGGAVWTGLRAAGGTLADETVGGMPTPLVVLVGCVALGLLLAVICRVLVAGTARTRAATADRRLREGVHAVSEELVVRPVAAELAAYTTVQKGVSAALK